MATFIAGHPLAHVGLTGTCGTGVGVGSTGLTRDPTWLQVEVCREYMRQSCRRDNTECKYAHPSANVDVQNGKVTVCFDAFKDRCTRSNCKYFHAPAQMKADLEMRGKMSLLKQKTEQALQNQTAQAQLAAAAAALYQPAAAQAALSSNPAYFHNGASMSMLQQAQTAAILNQYQQQLLQQQQSYSTAATAAVLAQAQQMSAGAGAGGASVAAGANLIPSSALSTEGNSVSPISDGSYSPICRLSPTTVEVCKDFQRNACSRSESECKFAHPDSNVQVELSSPSSGGSGAGAGAGGDANNNVCKVTVCMDFLKTAACQRGDKCKFYHPPPHIQETLRSQVSVGGGSGSGGTASPISSASSLSSYSYQHSVPTPNGPNAQHSPALATANGNASYNAGLLPNYGKMIRLDTTAASMAAATANQNKQLAAIAAASMYQYGSTPLFYNPALYHPTSAATAVNGTNPAVALQSPSPVMPNSHWGSNNLIYYNPSYDNASSQVFPSQGATGTQAAQVAALSPTAQIFTPVAPNVSQIMTGRFAAF